MAGVSRAAPLDLDGGLAEGSTKPRGAEAGEAVTPGAARPPVLTGGGVTTRRDLEMCVLALASIETRKALADVSVEAVDALSAVLTGAAGAFVRVEAAVGTPGSGGAVADEPLDGIGAPGAVGAGAAVAVVIVDLAGLSGCPRGAFTLEAEADGGCEEDVLAGADGLLGGAYRPRHSALRLVGTGLHHARVRWYGNDPMSPDKEAVPGQEELVDDINWLHQLRWMAQSQIWSCRLSRGDHGSQAGWI